MMDSFERKKGHLNVSMSKVLLNLLVLGLDHWLLVDVSCLDMVVALLG